MAARPFDSTDQGIPGGRSVARTRSDANRHILRYRLGVVASSASDVVRFAGGWLFDRVLAGWDVTVIVSDPANALPLRILGTTVLDLETSLSSPTHGPQPQAVAVTGELFESDERIRCGVLDTLERGLSEVTLLGEFCPSELNCRVGSVQHSLSVAARAFKAQALAAAKIPADSIDAVETFRRGVPATGLAAAGDLIPV